MLIDSSGVFGAPFLLLVFYPMRQPSTLVSSVLFALFLPSPCRGLSGIVHGIDLLSTSESVSGFSELLVLGFVDFGEFDGTISGIDSRSRSFCADTSGVRES